MLSPFLALSCFFLFLFSSFSPFLVLQFVPSIDIALLAECKITTSLAFAQMIFNIAANKPSATEKNLYKLALFTLFA